jgi:glycolate oxidase iron-sulfur subunit
MAAVADGTLPIDDPTVVEQAGYCLGCRACEPACPAGVPYGDLIEHWRADVWEATATPVRIRLLRWAVTRSRLITIGGRLRGAARRTGGAPAGTDVLFLGCVERLLYPGVSQAVTRLVPDIAVAEHGRCCGVLHSHNGNPGEGRTMADAIPLPPADGVLVSTAGGCATHLAHVRGRDRVQELSTYLLKRWQPAEGAYVGAPQDRSRRARTGFQDSCHASNILGNGSAARRLIGLVADLVEVPGAASCCGAAGSYAILRPRDAREVFAEKLSHLSRLDLDYLVTVNPGCTRHLAAQLRSSGSSTRVIHLAEFLAHATPVPPHART